MYIITNKENIIMHMSETLNHDDNGDILVDMDTLTLSKDLVKGTYEVEEVPSEVYLGKYCYEKEKGFYKNPNYIKQYSEAERIAALEETVNMLLGF